MTSIDDPLRSHRVLELQLIRCPLHVLSVDPARLSAGKGVGEAPLESCVCEADFWPSSSSRDRHLNGTLHRTGLAGLLGRQSRREHHADWRPTRDPAGRSSCETPGEGAPNTDLRRRQRSRSRTSRARSTDASISTLRFVRLSTLMPNGRPRRRQKAMSVLALVRHSS